MSTPDKDGKEQLATWVPADASRPYCTLPWRQIAVLSDCTAVCACVDAEKSNPLGNLATTPFDEVWNGSAYQRLRRSIAENIDQVSICQNCPNRIAGPPPPDGYFDAVTLPQALFLESHAGCNLACPGCNRTGIEGSRQELAMDYDAYRRIIDALAPGLRYMEFHLGGENYMHKRAHDMVRYCKEKNTDCVVLTSTNGHFFHTDERANDLLDSGIDAVIFSIDGVDQESYARYRANGNLERVLDGVRRVVAAKRERDGRGPLLIWRYILFEWNDSAEQMARAREMAADIGVDHLCWHINAVGSIAASKRYYVGSEHLTEIATELWDTLPGRLGSGPGIDLSSYHPD